MSERTITIPNTPARVPPPGSFVFETQVAGLGRFQLRSFENPDDIRIIHPWLMRDEARYWGMTGASLDQVASAYVDIARDADVYLGLHEGRPAFLVETYAPARDPIGEHYPVQPGDRGMHVLVAPADHQLRGFTWAVFRTVMEMLFADPTVQRVIVEPDIRNAKIHVLNRRAGFRYQNLVRLPHKVAHLAFCTRAQFRAACEARSGDRALDPTAHLRPDVWSAVNAQLVKKAIAELAHERLIEPRLESSEGTRSHYTLATDEPDIEYRFQARILQLDSWDIDVGSLVKTRAGKSVPLDALDFILELRTRLRIAPTTLPVYLEEIASTLYAAAFKHARTEPSAADLVHADFQEIEAAMIEGHPTFVANSGRVGFDAADYQAYAPEAAAPVGLVWVAAHASRTNVSCIEGLSYEQLMTEELGPATLAGFQRELVAQGLDPAAYRLIPVHPWQWFEKLALVFAPDLAARDLVCLGVGPDRYRAQQSIRTFFNLDHPHKRYVKTALSILNMGFMRGLSADYMRDTPAINAWIDGELRADSYFAEVGFSILREVAGIGYRNRYFESAAEKGSPYRKMLAALWRESPVPQLARGQRAMTMAALLHRDREGHALLPQLIAASGLDADDWLARYLRCYLAPLLHCFYRHDLAFMPHGENLILVLDGNVPVRAFLKDIAEEVVLMDRTRELPEQVRRIAVSVPDELAVLSIFTDVFDGILRYIAGIMVGEGYAEERLWRLVAACIQRYRSEHPDLAGKLDRHDLFAAEFSRSCLNRLQLANNRQMIDLTDPAKNLQFAGTLANPIAPYRDGGGGPSSSPVAERDGDALTTLWKRGLR